MSTFIPFQLLLHTSQVNKQQQKYVDLQKGAIISSTARPRFSLYNAPLVATSTTTTTTEVPKRNPILPNNAQLGPAPFRFNAQGFKLPSDEQNEDDIVMEAEKFDGYRKNSPQVGGPL
jgi:hypothetical protein